MSTVKCTNLQQASSASPNITLDASGNATVGNTLAMGSSFKRNRIINGDMRIDQRNAGASVTQGTASTYVTDRFAIRGSVTSKFTSQQSSVAPAGFVNSLLCTSSSAYTVGAAEAFFAGQAIEGFNVADLGWGTANAQSVTLSFWVRSSLTGTFGGSLCNYAGDRSYPFTYTISAANTWEFETITIPGDTTGTWPTNNNGSIVLNIGLGAGSTLSGTAGAWAGALFRSATGAVSVVGTNGATFYITGVQLEVGSAATPYERQIYSDQLAQCQRYYYRVTGSNNAIFAFGQVANSTTIVGLTPFLVAMRTAPTALEQSGTASDYKLWQANTTTVSCTSVPTFSIATTAGATTVATASTLSGTAGQCSGFLTNGTGYLGWSAEL
jgi:hypothetical protein